MAALFEPNAVIDTGEKELTRGRDMRSTKLARGIATNSVTAGRGSTYGLPSTQAGILDLRVT